MPEHKHSGLSRLLLGFLGLRYTTTQLTSIAVVFVVVVIQFLQPSPSQTPSAIENREGNNTSLPAKAVCANPHILSEPLAISQTSRMSLLDEARRVAAEFEYSVDDLKKGVKEFVREMGWFLYS